MANWYYYDENEQKQGPVDQAQFKALAAKGFITPATRIVTEDGTESFARKVKGLKFSSLPLIDNIVEPMNFADPLPSHTVPPSSQSNGTFNVPLPRVNKQATYYSSPELTDFQTKPSLEWLFDLKFNLCCVPFLKWITQILYVICLALTALAMIAGPFFSSYFSVWQVNSQGGDRPSFFVAAGATLLITLVWWIGCIIAIFFIRLWCEHSIFMICWFVDTRQAAQHIIAEKD